MLAVLEALGEDFNTRRADIKIEAFAERSRHTPDTGLGFSVTALRFWVLMASLHEAFFPLLL